MLSYICQTLFFAFTILVLGHAQSADESFHNAELDLKAGALLRRSDEEVSPTTLDPEDAVHHHQRSSAKAFNRHAQINALGHMVVDDAYDGQFASESSLEHEVNHTLALKIDASGAAQGLPEMSDDLVEDEENETHTQMVKHVRQLHSLKTGEMLHAIKRVNEMEEDHKPWSNQDLIQTVSVLQGHDTKHFANTSLVETSGNESDDERATRMALQNLDLSDPSSLAEAAMIPKGGAAKAVVGFLFGASWVVDEDYPFLCICNGLAICENCPLGTTCRMRRGAGNGAFGMAHAHWFVSVAVLISIVWPAHVI